MRDGGPGPNKEPPDLLERDSLCFSEPRPDVVLQSGQDGFRDGLLSFYPAAESNAAERLVKLKQRLRATKTEDFFEVLTEGLAHITGAQYAFVSKRILVDDENVAVEMPPIGEPGACLMGAAFYIADGKSIELKAKNFKYHAYSCPCAYMKHDKMFIIPERLNDFITDNPNLLAIPGEAYFGVPLWAEGKCFAHFGVMWSPDGAAKRELGWGYLEMLLHSLEDMIHDRILEGTKFAKPPSPKMRPAKVVPHEAVTVAQSLKPYARSLSHELRTPMQGVVGMLDVMYATVQEAAEGQRDPRIQKVFETLKENIEAVQDSSRRAVEAADNVVHAYDMNMGVPEASDSSLEGDSDDDSSTEKQPDIVLNSSEMALTNPGRKRRREDNGWEIGNPTKYHHPQSDTAATLQPDRQSGIDTLHSVTAQSLLSAAGDGFPASPHSPRSPPSPQNYPSESTVVPGLRHTSLQDVIQYVINDSLKVGGRPESAIAQETDGGEIIEVRMRSPSGEERIKIIEWSVAPDIPQTILIDERELAKMISCVFLNAIKFTDEGRIRVTARRSPKCRYAVIKVTDSGSGIPEAFIPNLFKPFSREDHSLTRASEGLGLGLLVAKGLARRLGGDLFCTRSETSGPNRGSDFEMRVPITPGDVCSRPGTPFQSRSPSARPSRPAADNSSFAAVAAAAERARRHDTPPTAPFGVPSPASQQTSCSTVVDDDAHATRTSPASSTNTIPPSPSPSLPLKPNPIRHSNATAKPPNGARRPAHDRHLATKYPARILVAEDNKINRKLLVSMLRKLGYTEVMEGYDGMDAVIKMGEALRRGDMVDICLMDLWMPRLDGFEASERILDMYGGIQPPIMLAVTADVTDAALARVAQAGMKGIMTKPFNLMGLEKFIKESFARVGRGEGLDGG
ncbi:hypothetical protein K490DRAFT_49853 [Saccharata proteae CBS 121410]|uniref:histidine kinase n=1 Tax=Saccharata proteae CBS 121410 TaxID=1314787 RepID=A0A9P4LVJ3_9PEZI|nr:hypothetical protein K490DRAFT_49853 [Saccharata proteae CBS 121410]